MALHQNDSETAETIKGGHLHTFSGSQGSFAPQASWKLRPPALPRKPKPFAPQSSGRWRLREPLRLTHFSDCTAKSIQCPEEQAIEEKSKGQLQLPLHLSSCPVSQPSGTPWCTGSFLPHIAGACADVPSF